jgi:hypothetical protein
MITVTELSKSELFALGEWLSEWPDNWSYKQVINWLIDNNDSHTYASEDEKVWVWEMVEDYSGTQIADFIDNTRRHFERFTQ